MDVGSAEQWQCSLKLTVKISAPQAELIVPVKPVGTKCLIILDLNIGSGVK